MKFGGAVNLAPSFLLNLIFMPFSAAFWQNLHKFNAKFAAVKFSVSFGLTALNLARLLKI